jgi:hypothetical protein
MATLLWVLWATGRRGHWASATVGGTAREAEERFLLAPRSNCRRDGIRSAAEFPAYRSLLREKDSDRTATGPLLQHPGHTQQHSHNMGEDTLRTWRNSASACACRRSVVAALLVLPRRRCWHRALLFLSLGLQQRQQADLQRGWSAVCWRWMHAAAPVVSACRLAGCPCQPALLSRGAWPARRSGGAGSWPMERQPERARLCKHEH